MDRRFSPGPVEKMIQQLGIGGEIGGMEVDI